MILIRAAEAHDHPRLLPLMKEIDRVHLEAVPGLPRGHAVLGRRAFLRELRSRHTEYLVAVGRDEVLGYAVVWLTPESELDRVLMRVSDLLPPRHAARVRPRTAFIDQVVVSPLSRREGVGSLLTEACVAWAARNGARAVELQVFDFNHQALELYSRLGFDMLTHRLTKPLGAPGGTGSPSVAERRPDAPS